MKINNVPGEFAFKALYRSVTRGFILSDHFYFSEQEAINDLLTSSGLELKWPVEVYDDGSVYIPTPEELE